MSFTRITPKNSSKQRQTPTKGYNFPMRTSFVLKSSYQRDNIDLTLETERENEATSQYERHLYMDGLCQNTLENLDNSTVEEEKIEARQRRVFSCSAVLLVLVCAISLISLVLTLLMLTGNINPKCSCTPGKGLDYIKLMGTGGFNDTRGKETAENGIQRWLIDVVRNITEKMDEQSRDVGKLKVNFTTMNESKEKKDKELQDSVKETKNDLDSKIKVMKAAMTHVDLSLKKLNTTSDGINKAINKLVQDLGETKKSLRLKIDSKVYKLQTKLNETAVAFHKQQAKIKEVSKTTNHQLNLTKDEINSSLQDISSDLLEMKTYFTKQVNNTKRTIEASRTGLQNSINNLNKTLLNTIKNMTKLSSHKDSSPGKNESSGFPGMTEAPGINHSGANFSQCRYKVEVSPATANTGDPTKISVDVNLREPKGKRIIGSTCSTNHAAEYNFMVLNATSRNPLYRCTCKGVSGLFKDATRNKIYCYLHYWECPFLD